MRTKANKRKNDNIIINMLSGTIILHIAYNLVSILISNCIEITILLVGWAY